MLSTLYIRLLSPIYQGRMSVPQFALQSKVRKAVPEQRQPASCRSMPELRRMSKQHGIPLYEASCLSLFWHIPPFIRIFPFRADSVMGKREHIPLCASLHIFRQIARRKESLCCLPGRPMFFTRPSRCSLYIIRSLRFYFRQSRPCSYNRCDFMTSPDAFRLSPVWFYRCKYRPSRLSLTF